MNKIKVILFFMVLFSMLTLLSACGSKGDLYQGDQNSESVSKAHKVQQDESQPQSQKQE